jgi:COP9 signalosome complex subunit 7
MDAGATDVYGEKALLKHVSLLETQACKDGHQPVTTKTAIQGALTDPAVFVFGSLLDHPAVAALKRSGEHADWVSALELFAFGTYTDFKKDKDHFPAALRSDVGALKKLKILTVAALAAGSRELSYDRLRQDLDVASVRDLEDVLIECFNEQLVQGMLDQRAQTLHVSSAFGRDVREDQIPALIARLDAWRGCSEALIAAMDEQIRATEEHERRIAERRSDLMEHASAEVERARKRREASRTGGMDGGDRSRRGPKRGGGGPEGLLGRLGSAFGMGDSPMRG